jgi:hypothetical protein
MIPLDDDGVESAASAFFRNDPYFPRLRDGPAVVRTFLEAILRVYCDHPRRFDIPQKMIEFLIRKGDERRATAGELLAAGRQKSIAK